MFTSALTAQAVDVTGTHVLSQVLFKSPTLSSHLGRPAGNPPGGS